MSDTSRITLLGSGSGSGAACSETPDAAILESFDNPCERSWAVLLDCREFTCLCPVTGQPDFGRILVEYVPGRSCVESKSLKVYLGSYRNHGAFHEACVNRIADDLVAAVAPLYLRVTGDFNARGGIAIHPVALRVQTGLAAEQELHCRSLLDQLPRPRQVGDGGA